MSHPNEELSRRGYEAFAAGDMETLSSMFREDIVWHVRGRSPLAGDHRGIDGVLGYFGRTMELTDGTFQVEVQSIYPSERGVASVHIARGQRSGRTLEDRQVLESVVQDGKFAEVWQYNHDQYGLDEFFA
jgi:uncharacterized protein